MARSRSKVSESEAAASAWAKGRLGGPQAASWLQRARRLAPNDPRIALDLARHHLAHNDPRTARALFAELAATHKTTDILTGLALSAQLCGDAQEATATLATLLARHCLPTDGSFTAFALHVAQEAGYSGFQGVSIGGTPRVRGEPPLLGTPDEAALTRVEGLASWEKDGVSGWASRPAAPGEPPELTLTDATGLRVKVHFGEPLDADETAPFLPRYRFRLPPRSLRGLIPPFRLAGPDGRDIMGSPLDPRPLAALPIPATTRAPAPHSLPPRAGLAVLVPVYRGLAETTACLESVFAALPADATLLVVDDATPESELAAWLDARAAEGRLTLLRHATNRGFCAAVNTGLTAAGFHDVVLLNADTLLPPGALETLRDVAYADASFGTVTPLSNEASLCSYPDPHGGNALPSLAETTRLNALARTTNGLAAVEIPTGVGFCLYIRHDCLAATGRLRGEIFAQGYGEENDFCLRAHLRGYRHMAAQGAYVAHVGAVSFRASARGLMARNLTILNRLYPGYHEMVLAHLAADRLHPFRAALDEADLVAATTAPVVLLISHSHGGGVARQVAAEQEAWRQKGFAPLLLTTQFPANPALTPYPWPARLSTDADGGASNLTFALPEKLDALLGLLKRLNTVRVVQHHLLGHHPLVRELAARLGVPQDIVVHDYASFCPRVNLLTPATLVTPPRYCGEPDVKGCTACVKRGGQLFETLPIPALLTRSATEFAAAESVTVPSGDTARRLTRHFPGLKPQIVSWEDDLQPRPLTLPSPPGDRRRIAVVGGIGRSKGFDLLRDCARDAFSRRLPLEFVVVGASADDEALLETGRIFVTGAYKEGEATALIQAQNADLAFLPSIWPETWCFALGEAWAAGLYGVVFDLGAQAERVRATGRGLVLPLGLPAARINAALLRWSP